MFKTERMTCVQQDLKVNDTYEKNTRNISEIGIHDLTTCELHAEQMHYIFFH